MFESKNKTAVTLVEILIVITIISILMGIVLGVANSIRSQNKEQLTKSTIVLLESSLQEYYDFQGDFPFPTSEDPVENSEFLYRELFRIPASRKFLSKISNSLIKENFDSGVEPSRPEIYDGWDTPILYEYTENQTFPTLISAGPDKIFETVDDNITNK